MEKNVKSLSKLLLLLVLLLSLFLRLYSVEEIPYGFDGDEAAFGYYGYSLLANNSDEYGNKFPLYFPSIGDYKYPIYAYLTTIPVGILGLNILSARLISVFAGVILSLVIYELVIELGGEKNVALLAALLTAVSPYSLIFSRGAYESNLALTLVSLGILMLVRTEKEGRYKTAIAGLIFFTAGAYTYSAARLFTILFITLFLIYSLYGKGKKLLSNKALIISAFLVVLISVLAFSDKRSLVRANDIGIKGDPKVAEIIEDSIHEDGLVWEGKNLYITRILHNKISSPLLITAGRYLEHFDPQYLFLSSNPSMPKYSVPNAGLFLLFEMITIPLGIYSLASKKKRMFVIMLFWLILASIPSALTVETPNPIRALIGLPAWLVFSAYGLFYLYEQLKKVINKKYVIAISVLFLFVSFYYFWHQYFVHDPYHEPWYTDGGMREMVNSVTQLRSGFDKTAISGDPYIFFLFFNKVDPQVFTAKSKIESEEFGKWERVEEYDDIIFKMPYPCPKIGRLKVLYVCRGTEVPQNSKIHDVVRFNDGVPAFTLLEFVPYSERTMEELPSGLTYMVDTDLSFEEGLLDENSGRYW